MICKDAVTQESLWKQQRFRFAHKEAIFYDWYIVAAKDAAWVGKKRGI